MWLLLLEAALALALLVFIVMWTMWPKRKDLVRGPATPVSRKPDEPASPGAKPDDKGQ